MNARGRAEGHTSRRWWPVAIGAAGVILLCAALFWPSSSAVPELSSRAHPASPAPKRTEPAPKREAPEAPKQLVAVHRKHALEASAEGEEEHDEEDPPYNENATPEGHPHYITPQHERIFRENNLIGSLNGAMQIGDFIAMRRFNAEYRKDYPEDDHRLHEGYEIIADCLEEPTDANKARAERFWKTQRASMLRRYVRRYCLSEP